MWAIRRQLVGKNGQQPNIHVVPPVISIDKQSFLYNRDRDALRNTTTF